MPHVKPGLEQVSINIRAKAGHRDLIDQAAEWQGRSRSDFMLDASCGPPKMSCSTAFFAVDSSTFAKLEALLDQPLPPTEKLWRTSEDQSSC
jgi:uncharacterized protein (DUF1778 family)